MREEPQKSGQAHQTDQALLSANQYLLDSKAYQSYRFDSEAHRRYGYFNCSTSMGGTS